MAEQETFGVEFYRDGERVTEQLPGVRVSEHFAFINRALTHIPSGMMVPFTSCWTIENAKHRAACLEALSFIDWSVKEPADVELTEEEQAHLRAAAAGLMPPAEVRRA
jgi:hypothetical protein